MISQYRLSQRLTAEFLGSFILVLTAISPIILGINVLGADVATAVLMDAIAVGLVLFVLIATFGPISGCHINPAVTLVMYLSKQIAGRTAVYYTIVQISGGLLGTLASHAMFSGVAAFQWFTISEVVRNGGSFFAEFIGTFVLVLVIFGTVHNKPAQPGLIIGLLVGGFLITTSSTMFANPAVTIARMFTWALAGIRPVDALVFIVVQLLGALAGAGAARMLWREGS